MNVLRTKKLKYRCSCGAITYEEDLVEQCVFIGSLEEPPEYEYLCAGCEVVPFEDLEEIEEDEVIRVKDMMRVLSAIDQEAEVRVGDVSEGSDLHCSVGAVVLRGQCVIVVPGDDDVWKDETLSSEILSRNLLPEEGSDENTGIPDEGRGEETSR